MMTKDTRAYAKLFKELGSVYRDLRHRREMVQEDVLKYGFSIRHYQQLESGRPHSLTTLFRVAKMFGVKPSSLLRGLEHHVSDH